MTDEPTPTEGGALDEVPAALDDGLAARVGPPPPARLPSLGSRMRSGRTIASFGLALLLLAGLAWRIDRAVLADAWQRLRGAQPGWWLAALGTYYLAFPVRAARWRVLLANAGEPAASIPGTGALAEIIYLSWFANALVPAKLGDVWRGWLVRRASGTSWTRAMGTIVAERALDLVMLVCLMVAAGFLTYGDVLASGVAGGLGACLLRGADGNVGCALARLFALGAVVVLALVIALVLLARFGGHLERRLPRRLGTLYATFAQALVMSFGRFGPLLGLSAAAWAAEGASFYLVGRALGLTLGAPLVVFFSLLQAFITAIPATPGGLGLEFILAGAIGLRGYAAADALALTALYRTISYLSLVVGGAIVFLLSPRTRSVR